MKRAISGIGVLIIFIALILVAAVAAMVLLQTVSSLEGQALATGKETKGEVSTKLRIQSVIGKTDNAENPTKVVYLRITAKLAPGSSDIILNHTIFRYATENEVIAGAAYNTTPPGENSPEGAYKSTNNITYSAVFLNYPPDMSQNLKTAVKEGDIVEFWYKPTNLRADTNVEISFILGSGATETVYFRTPSVLRGQYMSLFP
ncbi:hypothetical protein DRN74_01390 [Candidatus Micrarchaeota archaeon]|mgnify:CR=1 FL=1|nr:MAG: hypothetical protein DRN74_01390 [Candidatus Micrarchaeota archaeon]